jgi:mRNA interferase MazF
VPPQRRLRAAFASKRSERSGSPSSREVGSLIAVPMTQTIRGLATEMVLTTDDGLPVACAANFDHVGLAQRGRIGELIAQLRAERWSEVRAALLIACGFEPV